MNAIFRELVFRLYAMENDSDLSYVSQSAKDLEQLLSSKDWDVKEELDRLVLEKLLTRTLMADDPDVPVDYYYKLTPAGINEVHMVFGTGGPTIDDKNENDTIKETKKIIAAFENSDLPVERKSDYCSTLTEMLNCYHAQCFNATIALCGKLIEIYLTELLKKHSIGIEMFYFDKKQGRSVATSDLTLGQLFKLTEAIPEEERIAQRNQRVIELIKSFRNGAVHYKEKIPSPSLKETNGIVGFTLDILERRLTYNWNKELA